MLFFANVASVRDGILAAVADAEPRPTVVLLDLSLTPEVDVPVVEALEDLHERLAARRDRALAGHLRPDARDLLDRAGDARGHRSDADPPARRSTGSWRSPCACRVPRERVAVLTDLLAYIRERATQPGTSAEGVETLHALEQRLAAELAAGRANGQSASG